MRRLAYIVAVFVLLGAYAGPARAYERFPTFERLAAQVAGRPVEVRCAMADEWESDPFRDPTAAAYVLWRGDVPVYAVLGPQRCIGLLLLVLDPADTRASRLNPRLDVFRLQGEGLFGFAHEAAHLSGVRNETDADCAALRALPGLLAAIGVRGERAADFEALARRIHTQRPPEYREHPCSPAA